jgi:cytochrome c
MNFISRSMFAVTAAGALALKFSTSTLAAAVDAAAAKDLAQDNDCFKCHAVDKAKKGPSFKKTAAKYKGKEEEGMKGIIKQITTGPKIKMDDGTEKEHKIIDTKDQGQISNLAHWILAQ